MAGLHEGHNSSVSRNIEKSDERALEQSSVDQATDDPERQGSKEEHGNQQEARADDGPSMVKIILVGISLWFSVFLVSLVRLQPL